MKKSYKESAWENVYPKFGINISSASYLLGTLEKSGRGVKLAAPLQSGAEVGNVWSCASAPQKRLHGVVVN